MLSNAEQRNLYNFLGAEDYKVYKNQNSNFQNFFNSAFKIKTSFEDEQKSFVDKFFGDRSGQKENQFQRAFKEFFEEESSSEEEEEEESKNVYSFYNHFTMSCDSQKNQKNSTLFTQQTFESHHYNQKSGKSFHEDSFSTNFTYNHQINKYEIPEKTLKLEKNAKKEKNDKIVNSVNSFTKKAEKCDFVEILEKIKAKKPIFSIMRNQIRKKKKSGNK